MNLSDARPQAGAGTSPPVWCLALVGPRAAGKTTLARALGRALGWPSVDGDERIAARVGCGAGEWLTRVGEPAFRALEEEVTLEALHPEPAGSAVPAVRSSRVVALGGGAILSAAVRAALARPGVFTIFLDAPEPVLVERLTASSAPQRPPLTSLAIGDEVRALLAARRSLYEAVACVRLETFPANVDACCSAILAKIRRGS